MKPRQGIRHRAGWRPPILMYHRVGEGERDPLLRRFTLSRERFEAQMRCLRRLRCHAVSPEQIARWLEGGAHLPPRPVAITFDDGYADTYHIAAPILEAYGLRATLFLVSDYMGRKSTWDADVAAGEGFPLMSWEQAR
ncbi:MAG TPA: polysaccharide deacetylase family protein, partial [Armatimonadetes bacterium]|nr:polysaccharide deacetylase family protein [Armatimonadota bacterium]